MQVNTVNQLERNKINVLKFLKIKIKKILLKNLFFKVQRFSVPSNRWERNYHKYSINQTDFFKFKH